MAVIDLPAPRPGGGRGADAELLLAAAGRKFSLRIFDAGLACCAVEVAAAVRRIEPAGTGPDRAATADSATHVLVVAGTVTDKLAPLVRRAFEEMPEPKRVLSFGACSNSGGPYWDSYCVTKGVDQIIPVDVYIPGCPPRPETLVDGLRRLIDPQGAVGGDGPTAEADERDGRAAEERT